MVAEPRSPYPRHLAKRRQPKHDVAHGEPEETAAPYLSVVHGGKRCGTARHRREHGAEHPDLCCSAEGDTGEFPAKPPRTPQQEHKSNHSEKHRIGAEHYMNPDRLRLPGPLL